MRTKFFMIFPMFLMFVVLSGCEFWDNGGVDNKQQDQTEQLMEEAARQTGMPNITNFQQRKTMKMIQEQCDRADLVCYAYLQSEMTGKLIYIGRCIGYGVPFSAQYTNPERTVFRAGHGYVGNLPQPDPNGLFMPTSSSATWLLMLDDNDNMTPVYFEPLIVVTPFKFSLGVEN